jgi:acetyltransferase-like isoleucine patch superfamily enzyme
MKAKYVKPHPEHMKLTKWNWVVSYPENLKIGQNVDIGAFTYINAEFGVTIGDNVQIGSHCSIYSSNSENNTHGGVIIGNNSLIGCHTSIFPNSLININSKIKAYSIIRGEKQIWIKKEG